MVIGDGEGEAAVTIAGVELSFEVGGPQVVGLLGMGWDAAGVLMESFASSFWDQAHSFQEIPHGAGGGPLGDVGLSGYQPAEEFFGPPVGV